MSEAERLKARTSQEHVSRLLAEVRELKRELAAERERARPLFSALAEERDANATLRVQIDRCLNKSLALHARAERLQPIADAVVKLWGGKWNINTKDEASSMAIFALRQLMPDYLAALIAPGKEGSE